MFVSSKTFMELVERMTKMQMEIETLKERVKTLENRPIIVDKTDDKNREEFDMNRIFDEVVNGVPDRVTGKVRLTDGTD